MVGDTEEDEKEADGDDEVAEDDDFPILSAEQTLASGRTYVAYTIKLPSEQLAALQTIWLDLKKLYGTHSPDKSGMIQLAVQDWLKRWDGPERQAMLKQLLEIRQNTRKRQYRK